MRIAVLDACAMIAYLRGEDGADIVENLLADPNTTCLAHAVNLIEVYYDALRKGTSTEALNMVDTLHGDGVLIRRDIDDALLYAVGTLKAGGGVSIADCFCIALAQAMGAHLYTSDHHEFDRLLPLGLCSIEFIR